LPKLKTQVAPLALRASLRRKEGTLPESFRHDYAALAPFGRAGQGAKVVP